MLDVMLVVHNEKIDEVVVVLDDIELYVECEVIIVDIEVIDEVVWLEILEDLDDNEGDELLRNDKQQQLLIEPDEEYE